MTTTVGIKTKEGVVLGSDRRASKGFFIGSKITQTQHDTASCKLPLSFVEYL